MTFSNPIDGRGHSRRDRPVVAVAVAVAVAVVAVVVAVVSWLATSITSKLIVVS